MNKILMILLLPLLFILPSCDSDDEGSSACSKVQGAWDATSIAYAYSEECIACEVEDDEGNITVVLCEDWEQPLESGWLSYTLIDGSISADMCGMPEAGEPCIGNGTYACIGNTLTLCFESEGGDGEDDCTAHTISISNNTAIINHTEEDNDQGEGCIETITLILEK